MTPFGFYRQAYLAITDFRAYRLFYRQPLGRTVLYWGYLCAHAALIGTLALAFYQLPRLLDLLHWAEDNFPTLEIREGNLQALNGGRQPLVKEYLEQRVWTFAFDPGNQLAPHQLAQPAVIFNREQILVRVEDETQTWNWRMFFDSIIIDTKVLQQVREYLSWTFYPVCFVFLLIAYLGFKGLQAALFSSFSLLAGARMGIHLPFHQRFTISLYALTPAVAIDLLLIVAGQEAPLSLGIPLPSLIYPLIYIVTATVFAYQATLRCLTID